MNEIFAQTKLYQYSELTIYFSRIPRDVLKELLNFGSLLSRHY